MEDDDAKHIFMEKKLLIKTAATGYNVPYLRCLKESRERDLEVAIAAFWQWVKQLSIIGVSALTYVFLCTYVPFWIQIENEPSCEIVWKWAADSVKPVPVIISAIYGLYSLINLRYDPTVTEKQHRRFRTM